MSRYLLLLALLVACGDDTGQRSVECDDRACGGEDGCCPPGCTSQSDVDCVECGNGVIEAGETCDPPETCPTSCSPQGCDLYELEGVATACNAACIMSGKQTACQSGDDCCPSGCNANNDGECVVACDNGVVEQGENCDPLLSCPAACPQQGCDLFMLSGAGTCQAECLANGEVAACIDGDGCCPDACNANTDDDCPPVCPNGIVEPGETCDGNCPVCTETQTCYSQTGSAATCDVVCHVPVTTCGTSGDSCCAFNRPTTTGCSSANDAECPGSSWAYVQFPTVNFSSCTVVTIYQPIDVLGSYDFTLCQPPGFPAPVGDAIITQVQDDLGNGYNHLVY